MSFDYLRRELPSWCLNLYLFLFVNCLIFLQRLVHCAAELEKPSGQFLGLIVMSH
jgi:hypothetical protein